MSKNQGLREMRGRGQRGFSFIEILMVSGLVIVIISIVSLLMVQFRRNFSKGEESSIVLQEGGMFLAMLRNDLINAVAEDLPTPAAWPSVLKVGPGSQSLSFFIFRDAEGTIEPVLYTIKKNPDDGDHNSLVRIQGANRPRTLIDKHLASLTWNIGTEVYAGEIGSGARRLWLDLDVTLGGKGPPGTRPKTLRLTTKLFPTRLNRQINGSK